MNVTVWARPHVLSLLLALAVGASLVLAPVPAEAQSTFTPQPAISLGFDVQPRDVAVTTDGRRALVVTDDELISVDITTTAYAIVGRATNVFGSDLAVGSDGRTAYVGNDDSIYVVDVSSDKPRLVKRLGNATPDDVLDLAVRGKRLYASYGSGWASGLGNGVRIWSLATARKPVKAGGFKTASFPTGIAVSADGKRVITANNLVGSVTVADVSRKQPKVIRKELELPFDATSVVTVGSTAYVYGEDDTRIARVKLGSGRLGRIDEALPGNDGGPALAVSHDGAYFYTLMDQQSDDATVAIVDRGTMQAVEAYNGTDFPRGIAASSAGPSKGSFFVVWPGSTVYDTPAGFVGVSRAG